MESNKRDWSGRRRGVGRVEFLCEKVAAARELSSCCVGTERLLEDDARLRPPDTAIEKKRD